MPERFDYPDWIFELKWVPYDPHGMHEFTVESREPSTQHRLTRKVFDAWLGRPGGSPADVMRKNRLKELLGA